MALTNTDKREIERIARKEIKDFITKPQFKNEIQKLVVDEIKKGKNAKNIYNILKKYHKVRKKLTKISEVV